MIESQKKYAEQIVPFRLSWFPPYEFAGNYYWKDKVYRGGPKAGRAAGRDEVVLLLNRFA